MTRFDFLRSRRDPLVASLRERFAPRESPLAWLALLGALAIVGFAIGLERSRVGAAGGARDAASLLVAIQRPALARLRAREDAIAARLHARAELRTARARAVRTIGAVVQLGNHVPATTHFDDVRAQETLWEIRGRTSALGDVAVVADELARVHAGPVRVSDVHDDHHIVFFTIVLGEERR